MEINQYFENYINNLQKEIFLLAYDSNYDIVPFINAYMRSKVRKEMDKPYSNWHNQSSYRILEEVLVNSDIKKVDKQVVNKDAVEWLGFFYSKWHFITEESSKIILRFLPPKEGLKKYYVLHQLDEVEAIEICKRHYNLSRNNHRKNEYKNSDESLMIYDDPTYYSFLAVRLIYKLNRSYIFNKLTYIGDRNEYDFVDENYYLGIKGDVIFTYDNKNIIEEYKIIDELASNYSRRTDNSIYFCFIYSDYYLKNENDERLLLHIKELKAKYSPNDRRFKYLYFYMLGKIYEITPTNEVYIYDIPLSKKERQGIINEMKRCYLIK